MELNATYKNKWEFLPKGAYVCAGGGGWLVGGKLKKSKGRGDSCLTDLTEVLLKAGQGDQPSPERPAG